MYIGSWNALMDLHRENPEFAPVDSAAQIHVDSRGVKVLHSSVRDRIPAKAGLEDIIIVETDDPFLICRKGRSQAVRNIVAQLPKRSE